MGKHCYQQGGTVPRTKLNDGIYEGVMEASPTLERRFQKVVEIADEPELWPDIKFVTGSESGLYLWFVGWELGFGLSILHLLTLKACFTYKVVVMVKMEEISHSRG